MKSLHAGVEAREKAARLELSENILDESGSPRRPHPPEEVKNSPLAKSNILFKADSISQLAVSQPLSGPEKDANEGEKVKSEEKKGTQQ